VSPHVPVCHARFAGSLAVAIGAAVLISTTAPGFPLAVPNHSFESPGINGVQATGWTSNGGANTGGLNDFTFGFTSVPDGTFFHYLNLPGFAGPNPSVTQSDPGLIGNAQAGRYTLTVAGGRRNNDATTDGAYMIELFAGGTSIGSQIVNDPFDTYAPDTWHDITATGIVFPGDPAIGQDLSIRLSAYDGTGGIRSQGQFDNVRLDFQPAVLLVQYDPSGPQDSAIPVALTTAEPGVTASALTQVWPEEWSNTNVWPVGRVASSATVPLGEYVEFTVSPQAGNAISFGDLFYDKASYNGLGATVASIRSSVDGYATDISVVGVNPAGPEALHFDLSGMRPVSGATTFRIYFYGAPADRSDWDDLVGSAAGGHGLRLLGTVIHAALPGECFATIGNNDPNAGSLIRIDLETGAGTMVGPTGVSNVVGTTVYHGVPSVAIKSTGEIFVTDIGGSSNLYRVDSQTGQAHLVGSTGVQAIDAMSFDRNDRLLAVGSDDKLYILDESTGTGSLVAAMGALAVRGLAVDPATGLAWGSRANGMYGPGDIFTIDPSTGVTTLVGNAGGQIPALAFDPSGLLFATRGGGNTPNDLVRIDKVFGGANLVGPIGYTSVAGMDIRGNARVTENCRFVSSVVAVSSERLDRLSSGLVGPPNVYPAYGDLAGSWAGFPPDDPGVLDLEFADPAPINFVNVYETYHPGALSQIEVRNPYTGLFETVWTGAAAVAPEQSRLFTAIFPMTAYPVSEIRVTLSSQLVPGSNEIDAVSIGSRDLVAERQWASGIVAFSTEYGNGWEATQALGPPNRYPTYGDFQGTWASAGADDRQEFLELSFARPSAIDFVSVVETNAPGALDAVSVMNPNTGLYEVVWSGTAAPAPAESRILDISFPETRFLVSQVRLDFDSPAVPGWNEVDAVAIGRCGCTTSWVGVPSAPALPLVSSLEPVRPNPFSGATRIGFALRQAGTVRVEIYNLLGQRVTRLVDGPMSAGRHELTWNGRDGSGRSVAAGVYYVAVTGADLHATRKLVKIR
jgi:hypothetical protein